MHKFVFKWSKLSIICDTRVFDLHFGSVAWNSRRLRISSAQKKIKSVSDWLGDTRDVTVYYKLDQVGP